MRLNGWLRFRIGKGLTLAFFFITVLLPAQQQAEADFPVIRRLDNTDLNYKQLMSDVESNRKRLAVIRNRLAISTHEETAENLTIFQYTARQGDDLLFLAARSNIPYSAIASLNKLNNPAALETGKVVLIPSCPGIFIPEKVDTDLEKILGAARQSVEGSVELKIRIAGASQSFLFFPGEDFTPTERAYFLNSGFRFPLKNFRITSTFGMRSDPFSGNPSMHQGIDLAAPEGTGVFAVADGTVSAKGYDPVYGNYIIISHSNRWTSLYGHLQTSVVDLRTELKSGTLIGTVGSTGLSTGPHLHFELRQDGRAFDPAGRLRP
ncbi:MAG: M23 family metallopeptidase [Treponema sp.]|nr:M23 family metallopeptidase [Treponema sp.]